MTPDEIIDQSLIDNPPAPPQPTLARGEGELTKVVIRKADGRVFDLGKPGKPRSVRRLVFNRKLSRYKKECGL